MATRLLRPRTRLIWPLCLTRTRQTPLKLDLRCFWWNSSIREVRKWRYLTSKLITQPLVVSFSFFGIKITGQRPRISSSSSLPTQPALPSTVPVELSRIMVPDDTNSSGNVHGGTILKLIEHAGFIVSTRHCNSAREGEGEPLTTVLVRLERMDFHKPMYVGELAQLHAAVTYTSPHSVEVTVDVWAENIITGNKRITNTAYLWYVAIPSKFVEQRAQGDFNKLIQPVPQITRLSEQEREAGEKRYKMQKSSRAKQGQFLSDTQSSAQLHSFHHAPVEAEPHSVLASQTTLANLVLPSDCTVTGHLTGGSLMKMMDNAAGICAARHAKNRVVTVCIDEIDFHSPISHGEMVFVTSRLVYTSNKSMEIEVTTESEGLSSHRRVTNTAYFTFVSLGEDQSATPVPPLVLHTEEEKARYEQGRQRYENRKKARMEKMKAQLGQQN